MYRKSSTRYSLNQLWNLLFKKFSIDLMWSLLFWHLAVILQFLSYVCLMYKQPLMIIYIYIYVIYTYTSKSPLKNIKTSPKMSKIFFQNTQGLVLAVANGFRIQVSDEGRFSRQQFFWFAWKVWNYDQESRIRYVIVKYDIYIYRCRLCIHV